MILVYLFLAFLDKSLRTFFYIPCLAGITGYIERLTYQSDETGFTVAKMKMGKQRDLVCLVGSMPSIQPGETVKCYGYWHNDITHGRQFKVLSVQTETPSDVVGIQKYLGSGLIKGIGPVYASRIVNVFREKTLDVIDSDLEQLLTVPGIGKVRIKKI